MKYMYLVLTNDIISGSPNSAVTDEGSALGREHPLHMSFQ